MSPSEPTFTLEHEEQTWRVTSSNNEQANGVTKFYSIRLTRYGTGKVTIRPFATQHDYFMFQQTEPNVVLAIGRLLIAAARKAGATDA
jgi:hypothetical protein